MSAVSAASGRAWVRSALPVSVAMVRANSSVLASTASAIRSSIRPRSRGGTSLQATNAPAAAFTARSTSSAPARGTWAKMPRLAGFCTAIVSPEALSTKSPSSSIRETATATVSFMVAGSWFDYGESVHRPAHAINPHPSGQVGSPVVLKSSLRIGTFSRPGCSGRRSTGCGMRSHSPDR